MLSKRSAEGYLIIDRGDGPSITEAEAAKLGRFVAGVGQRTQVLESATITCAHCKTVVVLNPKRDRPRGYCRSCDAYVCDKFTCNHVCMPFDKLCDMIVNRIVKGASWFVRKPGEKRDDPPSIA